MTDHARRTIDTALQLEAAVRLTGTGKRTQITPAMVYRDNGGYHGPADDVACVTWDEIRALRDELASLQVEYERVKAELVSTSSNWVDAETRAKDRLGRIQELEAVAANEAAKFQAETRRTSELVQERDRLKADLAARDAMLRDRDGELIATIHYDRKAKTIDVIRAEAADAKEGA